MGLRGIKNTLNYGANRIRYLAPVPAGSRLRGRIAIANAEDVASRELRVTYGITIQLEGRDRPPVWPKWWRSTICDAARLLPSPEQDPGGNLLDGSRSGLA